MSRILKGGLVVTPDGEMTADIRIENEWIAEVAPEIKTLAWDDVVDCGGLLVLPGAVDAHVHYNMKTATGRTIDDFESGSRSAAYGGVTTVIDFASPIPGASLLDALRAREAEAAGRTHTDYTFHMEVTGGVPKAAYDRLGDLRTYGVSSVKIYTTYGSDRLPDEDILPLAHALKAAKMTLMAHCEDDAILSAALAGQKAAGRLAPRDYPASRPAEAETKAIRLLIDAARETGVALYIAHVSTGEGAALIAAAQKEGLSVTGETCPHYLLLNEDVYKRAAAPKYIMAPPLRTKADSEALWQALADGVLSCVSTDHCAFHISDKMAAEHFTDAIPGIGGSETLLPLLYSEGVAKGRISLMRLAQLLSENPAKLFGVAPQKGSIVPGADADLVLLDPADGWTVNGRHLHSNAEYSVFDGRKVTGLPVLTMRRGEVLCKKGKWLPTKPEGHFARCAL